MHVAAGISEKREFNILEKLKFDFSGHGPGHKPRDVSGLATRSAGHIFVVQKAMQNCSKMYYVHVTCIERRK